MKKNYMNLFLIAVVSLFVTTACSKEDDGEEAPVAVSFKTLVANGASDSGDVESTSSMLTLTFDSAIEGLTADDLTLSAGTTGTTKGALTAKGQGVYELAVSGITATGEVSVSVAKAGYEIAPASKKTNVYYVAPAVITNKALIAAIETATKKTFTKNAAGDVEVAANQAMIDGITTLAIAYKEGLNSLEGIEYFTKLTKLNCSGNKLTTLDVSKLTALTYLECASNKLTVLDVSKNTALTSLYCRENKLSALDVSKNTALIEFSCPDNKLTALDVSKNTALTLLDCSSNELTAIDVSKNTALTELNCSNNKLTALDVTKNTALTTLYCSRNTLTTLDVSKNTALVQFTCHVNSLTALDITTWTAINWAYMQCGMQVSKLTLTVTAAQKAAIPNSWKSESTNANVTLQEAQ